MFRLGAPHIAKMCTKPRLDHLTILYTDRAASEAFYGALLPLIGFANPKPGIWTDGDGFWLQFMKAKEGTRPYERYGVGLNHWVLGMPSAESVHALRDALIEAGLEPQPVQDLDGAQALLLPDPYGLRIELTWYPPGVDVVG